MTPPDAPPQLDSAPLDEARPHDTPDADANSPRRADSATAATPALALGPLASLVDGALVVMERRLHLLGADLEAERRWLERRAWMSAIAGVAWLHALALVTVLGVAAAWDTWRLGAIATACAAWSAVGCGMALWLRVSAHTKRPFLAATRYELQRDRQALRRGAREGT